MSLRDLPRLVPGKTNSLRREAPSSFSTATARDESGTRCSRSLFMRSAGTTHSRSPKSNSFHRAPRASPVLAAVRITNSSARGVIPSLWRNLTIKPGSSR